MSKSPAFQLYPADFLADAQTAVMTAEEIGIYFLLICYCWNEGGLPPEIKKLSRLARVQQKKFSEAWNDNISHCFIFDGAAKLWQHPRLDVERRKQTTYKEAQSEKGKKSAQLRLNRSSNSGSTAVQPEAKSLFSISSSSSDNNNGAAVVVAPRGEPAAAPAAVFFDSEKLISEFQGKDGYRHLDARIVMQKMLVYCEERSVEPSRKRYISWLNREYPANTPKPEEDTDEFIRNYGSERKKLDATH